MALWKMNTASYPRDGKFAWFVCFCSTLAIGFALGTEKTFGVFLPIWSEEFKLGRGSTAWIGTITSSGIFLFSPVSIALSSYFGERVIAFCGCIVVGIAILISSFVKEIIFLYLSYGLLFGIGGSFILNASVFMVKRCFHKKLGLALGCFTCGGSLGMTTLAPSFQALIDALGWRNAMRVMSSIWIFVSLLTLSYNPRVQTGERQTSMETAKQKGVRNICKNFINFSLLKSPKYTLGTIVIWTTAVGYYVKLIFLVSFAKDRNISASKASLLFIFIGVCSGVARIITGKVMDKKWICSLQGLQLSSFTMGTSLLLLPQAREYYHFILITIYFGFGSGIYIFCQTFFYITCFGNLKKDVPGYGMGQIAKTVPVFIGPPIVGFIADEFNSYVPAFYIIGGIVVCSAALPFCLVLLQREKSRDPEDEMETGSSLVGVRLANIDSPSLLDMTIQHT